MRMFDKICLTKKLLPRNTKHSKSAVNVNCLLEQNTHFILLSDRVSPTTILHVTNPSRQEMKVINNHLLRFVYPICTSLKEGVLPK